jgi:hypothetical protein
MRESFRNNNLKEILALPSLAKWGVEVVRLHRDTVELLSATYCAIFTAGGLHFPVSTSDFGL